MRVLFVSVPRSPTGACPNSSTSSLCCQIVGAKTNRTTDGHRCTRILCRERHLYYYHLKSAKASQIFRVAFGYQCESVCICGSVFLVAASLRQVHLCSSVVQWFSSFSTSLTSTGNWRSNPQSLTYPVAGIWTCSHPRPLTPSLVAAKGRLRKKSFPLRFGDFARGILLRCTRHEGAHGDLSFPLGKGWNACYRMAL
jgi:hypothetical protein